ncbi:unnamed protein product [Leptosia nina]|uniref:Uncharacterized protein n=1 Tax=Leptosia nina TaxID=320188 RepID=A0AAV1JYP3_9NEOP
MVPAFVFCVLSILHAQAAPQDPALGYELPVPEYGVNEGYSSSESQTQGSSFSGEQAESYRSGESGYDVFSQNSGESNSGATSGSEYLASYSPERSYVRSSQSNANSQSARASSEKRYTSVNVAPKPHPFLPQPQYYHQSHPLVPPPGYPISPSPGYPPYPGYNPYYPGKQPLPFFPPPNKYPIHPIPSPVPHGHKHPISHKPIPFVPLIEELPSAQVPLIQTAPVNKNHKSHKPHGRNTLPIEILPVGPQANPIHHGFNPIHPGSQPGKNPLGQPGNNPNGQPGSQQGNYQGNKNGYQGSNSNTQTGSSSSSSVQSSQPGNNPNGQPGNQPGSNPGNNAGSNGVGGRPCGPIGHHHSSDSTDVTVIEPIFPGTKPGHPAKGRLCICFSSYFEIPSVMRDKFRFH